MAKVPQTLNNATKKAGNPGAPTHYVPIPGVDVEPQLEKYWCWAAVTAAIHNYFDATHDGGTDQVEQCDVVERVKGLATGACCGAPDTFQDETEDPKAALAALGHLKSAIKKKVTKRQTKEQLDAGNPMGMYIKRDQADVDHLALIAGYAEHPANAEQPYWLVVQDPSPQRYLMPYEKSPEGGAWTKTYFTKKH